MASKVSESELNARYTAAAYRFAQASGWKEYLELADEFRALDTYRDSAAMYQKCVKAASAPAYREVKERLDAIPEKTVDDYREAARVMGLIQDYSDAREMMRVYTVKANALTYEAAMALVSNSEATTEELGQGVEMFKSIKTFKNSRDLIERYEKYYFNRVYEEASELMNNGHVWSEFDEAADLFEKISEYSDAAEQAAKCRKKANQMRPKKKKEPKKETPAAGGDEKVRVSRKDLKAEQKKAAEENAGEAVPKKRRGASDETVNAFVEVWKTLDKRRLVFCILFFIIFVAALYASVWVSLSDIDWVADHLTTLRGIITPTYIIAGILCVREFFRMLTKSMRRKIGKAALRIGKKLAAPFIRAVTKLLGTIGIDLSRRNRLGGRDEKTFVYNDTPKEPKRKKKLKNDLKWAEQEDNAARVRFIFIDYMIRRIKGGYLMRRCMTPAEIGKDIALEDDEKELFRVYNLARYAGKAANEDISDALVGELKAVNQRRS